MGSLERLLPLWAVRNFAKLTGCVRLCLHRMTTHWPSLCFYVAILTCSQLSYCGTMRKGDKKYNTTASLGSMESSEGTFQLSTGVSSSLKEFFFLQLPQSLMNGGTSFGVITGAWTREHIHGSPKQSLIKSNLNMNTHCLAPSFIRCIV